MKKTHIINFDFKIEDGQFVCVEMNDGLFHADYSKYDKIVSEELNAMAIVYRYLSEHYDHIYIYPSKTPLAQWAKFNLDVSQENTTILDDLNQFVVSAQSYLISTDNAILVAHDRVRPDNISSISPPELQALLNREGVRIPVISSNPILRACMNKPNFYEVFKSKQQQLPRTAYFSKNQLAEDVEKFLAVTQDSTFIVKPATGSLAQGALVVRSSEHLSKIAGALVSLSDAPSNNLGDMVAEKLFDLQLSESEQEAVCHLILYFQRDPGPLLCIQNIVAPQDSRTGRVVVAITNDRPIPLFMFWRHAQSNSMELRNENLIHITSSESELVTEDKEIEIINRGVQLIFADMSELLNTSIMQLLEESMQLKNIHLRNNIVQFLLILQCIPELPIDRINRLKVDHNPFLGTFLMFSLQYLAREDQLPPLYPDVPRWLDRADNALNVNFLSALETLPERFGLLLKKIPAYLSTIIVNSIAHRIDLQKNGAELEASDVKILICLLKALTQLSVPHPCVIDIHIQLCDYYKREENHILALNHGFCAETLLTLTKKKVSAERLKENMLFYSTLLTTEYEQTKTSLEAIIKLLRESRHLKYSPGLAYIVKILVSQEQSVAELKRESLLVKYNEDLCDRLPIIQAMYCVVQYMRGNCGEYTQKMFKSMWRRPDSSDEVFTSNYAEVTKKMESAIYGEDHALMSHAGLK